MFLNERSDNLRKESIRNLADAANALERSKLFYLEALRGGFTVQIDSTDTDGIRLVYDEKFEFVYELDDHLLAVSEGSISYKLITSNIIVMNVLTLTRDDLYPRQHNNDIGDIDLFHFHTTDFSQFDVVLFVDDNGMVRMLVNRAKNPVDRKDWAYIKR